MDPALHQLADVPPAVLRGKRVLLRLDLNVPIAGGQVTDDFRLTTSLPTIECLRAAQARTVIVSHLGRRPEESLRPVANFFEKLFPIRFCAALADLKSMLADLPVGGVLLLENIRREIGEEKNDDGLARTLAAAADLYVNDAFASSHRAHASIVGVPNYLPGLAGFQLVKEMENLARAFTPPHPFIIILGGAKFETKLPLLRRFIIVADKVVVYGALAHAFFKELGYEIGESLVDKDTTAARPFLHHPKIILPIDVRVKNGDQVFIKRPNELAVSDNILDVGLLSVEKLLPVIGSANFVLWNGPLGNFEQGFRGSTEAVAKLIASSNAESIVGGGDTVAAIRALNLLDQFDFVSTGGGAMLDFLAYGTLPGIEALRASLHFRA